MVPAVLLSTCAAEAACRASRSALARPRIAVLAAGCCDRLYRVFLLALGSGGPVAQAEGGTLHECTACILNVRWVVRKMEAGAAGGGQAVCGWSAEPALHINPLPQPPWGMAFGKRISTNQLTQYALARTSAAM
jgi:hypothetical protein